MISLDLKKEYQKLYDQWLQEFETFELTPLNDESFTLYKNVVMPINIFELDKNSQLQIDLLEVYKKNIKFLFDDLLKIREIKIINSSLALKEVNLNNLIEIERLLYQKLVATIKGYKKVKAFSIEIEKDDLIHERVENIAQTSLDTLVNNNFQKAPIQQGINSIIKDQLVEKRLVEEIDIQYTLIRFIKKTPPLVGMDLKNYGPFEENDIANIPNQNANILLSEKYAEKIDLD